MDLSNKISSPNLELHLFGRFQILINDQLLPETEIKGRKARTLLKLISHQRNLQMVRDHATDILWSELDADAANAQLYKALHHIRKAFSNHNKEAADWIEITDNLIKITPPGGLVTDVQQFEKAARSGLKDQDVVNLENAVSIYSGDFLPVERYAQWASHPREHYRQLYLDVLTALAFQYEERGELSEAAEKLREALEKEPTLETAHRALMRIFARKRQETRAFHQYDICREILGEELGMSPSSETKKVLDDIREGKFADKKEIEKRERAGTVTGAASPIIGRVEECARINEVIEQLGAGQGKGLIISGEAGIGKTRLVQELIQRVRRKEFPFFVGKTGTKSGNVAYGPFIDLIEDILHDRPDLEDNLPIEFGRLIPGFSGNSEPAPHADKLAAKGYLFAKVQGFFSKIVNDKPVVLFLENLQDADQGSRELFHYLMQHLKHLPILFVITLRKEEGEAIPEYLSNLQKHSVEILELAPFTYEEHINLLHQHADDVVIGADSAGHIYHLAEGNPLYAIELLRHYTENDENDPSQHQEQTGITSTSLVSEKIPASIHYMVEQKLEQLSPPARHLLNIAAVIGRQVPYELLASIWSTGKNGEEVGLFKSLEEVIRFRLLVEHGLDYSFRHALVQETIYESISEARRQILHRQVAERLMEFVKDADEMPVEQIARHYLGAGEIIKGAGYLKQAGNRAEDAYAHEDALRYYREASEALDQIKNEESIALKYELLERIGDVYRACGKLEKTYGAYEEAISLAEDLSPDNPDLMELHRKMSVAAIFRTDIPRSEKHLEKAFKLAGDDSLLLARLYITKALHLWHLNKLEEAYELAQKAHTQAKANGVKAEISQACEILAMICLPLGRWEEGLKYEKERQIHGWSPEIVVATDAHLCLWEYHVSGEQPLQQARNFIEQVSEKATQVGDLRCVAVCHYALGTMHLWRGDRRQAVDELASSLELHERVGSPAGMAYALARKSVLHTLMGAKELGWQAVLDGLMYAKHAAVRDHCLQRLYGVGIWNRLAANDLVQAGKLIKKSEELLVRSGACAACALELYPWLAYYYLQTGQVEKAKECCEAVTVLAEQTGNPIGKAIASIIESNLCITEKDPGRAEEYSNNSWKILNETVPDTGYSPIAHYLEKMVEQQAELA
ncbi:MAG: AAA family ATPase [Balneolaceae bacterium]